MESFYVYPNGTSVTYGMYVRTLNKDFLVIHNEMNILNNICKNTIVDFNDKHYFNQLTIFHKNGNFELFSIYFPNHEWSTAIRSIYHSNKLYNLQKCYD